MISNESLHPIYRMFHSEPSWYIKLDKVGLFTRDQLSIILSSDEMSKEDKDIEYQQSREMRKRVFDFVEEVYRDEEDWCDECRLNYLEGRKRIFEEIICDILKVYSDQRTNGVSEEERQIEFQLANIDKYKNSLKKVENEIHFLKNKKEFEASRLTPQEIELAEQYPIEDLVDVNAKGFARCINHVEQNNTPGMFCRKNFAYCYSCGWAGNTIMVYRKIHNASFVDAVKFLSSRKL